MKTIILLLCTFLPLVLFAVEEAVEDAVAEVVEDAVAEVVEDAVAEVVEDAVEEVAEEVMEEVADEVIETRKEEKPKRGAEPVPEADRLKQRDLGDAFQRFVPSEAISADNAVPFPVDI